jgi:hypothetical protein
MYGDTERAPEPSDVVTYLHWCRSFSRVVADTGRDQADRRSRLGRIS